MIDEQKIINDIVYGYLYGDKSENNRPNYESSDLVNIINSVHGSKDKYSFGINCSLNGVPYDVSIYLMEKINFNGEK